MLCGCWAGIYCSFKLVSIPSCLLSDGESPGCRVHYVSRTPVLAIETAVGIISFCHGCHTSFCTCRILSSVAIYTWLTLFVISETFSFLIFFFQVLNLSKYLILFGQSVCLIFMAQEIT